MRSQYINRWLMLISSRKINDLFMETKVMKMYLFCINKVVLFFFFPILLYFLSVTSIYAATFSVNTTDDNNLGGCNISHCSLREAIIAANTVGGSNIINFNIDRNNPANNCTIATGDVDKICKIIINSGSPLPAITSTITIDGSIPEGRSNIPGSINKPSEYATLRPGIELDGELLPVNNSNIMAGLKLVGADNSVIKGMNINNFPGPAIESLYSSHVVIIGNYLGTDRTGTLRQINNDDNSGTSACLSNCYGNRGALGDGVFIGGGTDNRVGGTSVNERNLISNNRNTGITFTDISNSTIVGNFLGSNIYGLANLMGNRAENMEIRSFTPDTRPIIGLTPNNGQGVSSDNNKIIGNLSIQDRTRANLRLLGREYLYKTSASDPGIVIDIPINNTFVGNNLIGIDLAGHSSPALLNSNISISDVVFNSKVGFDVDSGSIIPMPNKIIVENVSAGIALNTSIQNRYIGSTANGNTGVPVYSKGESFLYNQFSGSANNKLSIDLAPANLFNGDGPTLNNSMGHVGPNHWQNFPVLDPDRSFENPALIQVEGDLDSSPNSNYLIQVFSNDNAVCMQLHTTPVPFGYFPSAGCTVDAGSTTAFLAAKGQVLVGEIMVLTDAGGHAHFKFPAKLNRPIGSLINATATLLNVMPDGSLQPSDTSEFSQAIDISQKGSANAYIHADGAAGGDNGQAAGADPCSDPNSIESTMGVCSLGN